MTLRSEPNGDRPDEDGFLIIDNATENIVAQVLVENNQEEMAKLARVLAAAPEMREALEHAIGALLTHEEDYRALAGDIRTLLTRIDNA